MVLKIIVKDSLGNSEEFFLPLTPTEEAQLMAEIRARTGPKTIFNVAMGLMGLIRTLDELSKKKK